MRLWFVVALALTPGCSDHAPPPAPAPAAPAPPAPIATHPSMFGDNAGSGGHLDDDVGPRPVQPTTANHHGQAIDIVLRSSPSGAMAAVDGVSIGVTPTNWSGTADGQPHEFTFTRSGYAFARYRFVPITSGVIHARLEPIGEDADAGVPPAPTHPNVAPPFTPTAPPTIISVDAGLPTPLPTGGAGPQP